jgi:hypothetical protein
MGVMGSFENVQAARQGNAAAAARSSAPRRELGARWSVSKRAVPEWPAEQRLRWWLIGLEVLLALGAFGGAYGLISGTMALEGSSSDLPSNSPVFGGVALAVVNGVLPAVVAYGAARRARWAETGHLVVGVVLMGWILVQIGFIGVVSWLQPALFAWGAVILALGQLRRRSLP